MRLGYPNTLHISSAPPSQVGASLGLAVQLYSNAVRKLPLMRNPWEHLIAVGAGAAAANWVVGFEERTQKEVDALVLQREQANKGRF